jgi:hypothetical protein
MGSVTLNFGNARTVLPPGMTAADLASFTLVFTPVPAATPITRTLANASATANVPVGNYTLVVRGNSDFGVVVATASSANGVTSTRPLAGLDTNGLIILEGEDTAITVVLTAAGITGTGNGRFAWNPLITTGFNTTTVTDADVTLIRNGETTPEVTQIIYPLPTPPATVIFPTYQAGSYWFDVFIETDDGYINYRDTVHIYQGMTSTITIPTYIDGDPYNEATGTTSASSITFNFTAPGDLAASVTITPTTGSGNTMSGSGTQSDPYMLSLTDVTNPGDLTFTLNANIFTNTQWFGNKGQLGATGAATITIIGDTTPGFQSRGLVSIAVGGTIGGELYSFVFYVRITS